MIYLDYASTTPVDQRVLDTMLPYFHEQFGNAASRTHEFGSASEEAVKMGRTQVGSLIGAKPEEIVFTSGATEAINLALKGVYEANQTEGKHIITIKTEHKAVLDTCKYLESQGASITYLSVNEEGLVNLQELEEAITDQTILISVMWVNNETGVIQPIREIGELAHQHDVLFMTDATQAVGKMSINVIDDHIDLLTCSAHKLYGPKGIGALYIKRKYPKIKIAPIIHGGGHERGFRSGTLNSPLIVGFGKACEVAKQEMAKDQNHLAKLRKLLEEGLSSIEGFTINGSSERSLPNILNCRFGDIDGEAFIMAVRNQLAIANGSACTSAEILPSHVIMAMNGGNEDLAYSSLRISVGRFTTEDEVVQAIDTIKQQCEMLRSFTL